MRFRPHLRRLSSTIELAGDQLPTEFLIFKAGDNYSRKGGFKFDDEAARAVMSEYEKGGIQLCLDLEHDSLDPERRKARSDAGDAMGWYDLALHEDGSLWAVNVKWSSEGERRLRNKLQRYTSPAFFTEESEDGERPIRLINIALCAMPATLENEPLIAATDPALFASALAYAKSSANSQIMKPKLKKPAKSAVKLSLSPEEAKKAVDLITSEKPSPALDFVIALLASAAAGGESVTEPEPDDGSGVPELSDPAPVEDPAKKDEAKALALTMLAELTGIAKPEDAIARFRQLSERMTKLAEDEAATELNQRRDLLAKLVVLGYETPASAWEGKPEDRKPKARHLAETIPEMKARVADLETRPIAGHQAPHKGASGTGGKVITLSDGREVSLTQSEVGACTEAGAKLEDYAANKATREAARATRVRK